MTTQQRKQIVPVIKDIISKWAPVIERNYRARGKMNAEIKRTLKSLGTTLEDFLSSYKKVATKHGEFTKSTAWVQPLFEAVW